MSATIARAGRPNSPNNCSKEPIALSSIVPDRDADGQAKVNGLGKICRSHP
jgi:hypothetical protein